MNFSKQYQNNQEAFWNFLFMLEEAIIVRSMCFFPFLKTVRRNSETLWQEKQFFEMGRSKDRKKTVSRYILMMLQDVRQATWNPFL
jgi:hypothetical protein